LYGSLPDINSFKVFGCLCFASTLLAHRSKLQSRARKSVFLGYKSDTKGYVLYDLDTREIFVSRNVVFRELILPYNSPTPSSTSNWQYHSSSPSLPAMTEPVSPSLSPPISPTQPTDHTIHLLPSSTTNSSPTLRVSSRTKKVPSYLQDYICPPSTISASHVNKTCGSYPLSNFISHTNLSNSQHIFALSLVSQIEPKSYVEAIKFDCWKQAMQLEPNALDQTGTWTIVDLPSQVKHIGCRWVYRIKYNDDGSIERYKARLVAKRYNQFKGLDYFETFSPVSKVTTVRLVIALASINHWFLHQLDVNYAFLHDDLQ